MFRAMFAESWINPNSELTEKLTSPVLDTSKNSQKVRKVFSNLNVFTLFTSEVENTLHRGKVLKCIQGVQPGPQHHPAHELWHHSDADKSTHVHLVKPGFQPITPEELACLFDNLKKADMKEGHCKNGKTRCYIADQDAEKILRDYKNYFNSSKDAQIEWKKHLAEADIKFYDRIWNECSYFLATFAHAFGSTFIQVYLKPYLHNQGYRPDTIKLICGGASTLLTYILTTNPWQIPAASALRTIINGFFSTLGLDKTIAEWLSVQLSTTLSLARDPFSVFSLLDSTIASTLGVSFAYGCIHQLPKLRIEPADHAENIEPQAIQAVPAAGLRRR